MRLLIRFVFAIAAIMNLLLLLPSASAQEALSTSESTIEVRHIEPDQHLLRLILETSPGKTRSELIEEYHQRFPRNPARDQVCEAALEGTTPPTETAGILAAAEALLAKDCLLTQACRMAFSVAVGEPAAESTLLWAKRCHGIAQKELREGEPKAAEGEAPGGGEAAQSMRRMAEYRIFTLSWNARGSAAQRYLDELRALNPHSEYVVALYERALHEALASNDMPRMHAVASRCLQANPESVPAILALANAALSTRQGLEQVVPLTTRALGLLDREAIGPAVTGERQLALRRQKGQALWIQGTYFAMQRRWKEADTALRQSLPLVQETRSMLASALYYLGLANSQLDRHSDSLKEIRDAVEFLERCVAMGSQHKAEAALLLASLKPLAQR